MPPRWYVVQTHPNAEANAMKHLVDQGFEVYFPRYRKRRSHARKVELVAAPFFPRYLFVAVDMQAQRWRSIKSSIGVSRLVCNGDDPAPMPLEAMVALRQREDADGFIKLDAPSSRFAAGDRVRIFDGKFAGSLGLFDGMADRDRVAILINLLGHNVPVVLDEAAIVGA
jgi:transcriptional antiterminator RfaH